MKSPEEMKHLFHRRDGDRLPPLIIQVQRDRLQLISQRIVLVWLALNAFILSLCRSPLLLRVLLWICFAFGGVIGTLLLWRVLS